MLGLFSRLTRSKERGREESSPPYPHRHSGPALVAGNAECLFDDLGRARSLFGADVPVIAVNGAAQWVKAFALVSQHPERMVAPGFEWAVRQRNKFGPDFTVHAPGNPLAGVAVDHWWPTVTKGGGSAWVARKIAGLMGFSPVVLCGCPLEPGPYVGHHNIGGFMHRSEIVSDLRNSMMLEPQWFEGARSMSGWTRELLGEGP